MNAQPLVSIVTPSYNQASFLEHTMRSVLEQDYAFLEYLVVDGGSTDGSVDIIRGFGDKLAWWVSEADSGQAEAINKGLQRACGEIVAWLNSDDIYLPGAIGKMVTFFQQNPRVDLVYGDLQAIDEKGQIINLVRFGDWGLQDLMEFRIIGQPAVFFRRSVLEKAGLLNPGYHYLLDHHLWLRIAQHTEFRHLPQPLAAARYHAGAKNVARPGEFSAEIQRIAAWMETQPGMAEVLLKNRRRIEAGMHNLSAFYLLEDGKASQALREHGRAFSAHPLVCLRAWRRIIYAILHRIGLRSLRNIYLTYRRQRSMRS